MPPKGGAPEEEQHNHEERYTSGEADRGHGDDHDGEHPVQAAAREPRPQEARENKADGSPAPP